MADDSIKTGEWEYGGETPSIRFFKSDAALASTDRAQITVTFKRHRLIANTWGAFLECDLGAMMKGEDILAYSGTQERAAVRYLEGEEWEDDRPYVCIADELTVDTPFVDFLRQSQTWQSVQPSYAFDPTTAEVSS